ncbi:PorV/PorQ family protein, partial [Xanthovirga aplysinae]|uniref:putative type IX sorting system protein PorV2 n=1 Tax=Xanthovirga aplysinae TaxID=2529853 RepID=UPI0012BB67DD
SNEFLSIGIGARGLGMSGAQVALASDVTAAYWNPAGLMQMKQPTEISLMHSEYFAGIAQFDYAALATRVDENSRIAFSVIRFAVDDIPDTRFLYDANGRLDYDNILFFSAADYAFLFSYAKNVAAIQGLSLGTNFKIIYRNVGAFANAWGFGLDAAARYQSGGFQLGILLKDVTGTFNAWTHSSELVEDIYVQTGNLIPESSIELTLPKAILGVGYQFRFFGKRVGVLPAMDFEITFDGRRNVPLNSKLVSMDPRFGLEIDYLQKVFLRGGLGNIQKVKDFDGSFYSSSQINFGLGISIQKISIDYALTDLGNQSEALYSHVFSLKFSLNK